MYIIPGRGVQRENPGEWRGLSGGRGMRDSEGSSVACKLTNGGTLTTIEQNHNSYIDGKIIPAPENIMTEETAPQPLPTDEKGKFPIGFWWITIGIILVLCGFAIVISVLPQLLDGSIMTQSSHNRHSEIYFIGPVLPGLFAIWYGLDLRRKAGLLKLPGILAGISNDDENK